jgi:hypothetical protein
LQFFFYWIRSGLADIWVISFFLDYFGEIWLIWYVGYFHFAGFWLNQQWKLIVW